MKQFPLIVLSALALFFTSCTRVTGEGPVVNENRHIVNFSGVDLRMSGDVYFTQAPDYKVEIKAQQNILDILETHVSNNKLVIKFKNDVRVRTHEPVMILVSAPTAGSFRISGSGNISVMGSLQPPHMEMDISGSGNITLSHLVTPFLDANISGSGNIQVMSGSATEEKLRISGSGNIDLRNLASERVTTTTSGSGDIRVRASQSLHVTISGSGSVYYQGNPVVNTSISGSGKIIHQ